LKMVDRMMGKMNSQAVNRGEKGGEDSKTDPFVKKAKKKAEKSFSGASRSKLAVEKRRRRKNEKKGRPKKKNERQCRA